MNAKVADKLTEALFDALKNITAEEVEEQLGHSEFDTDCINGLEDAIEKEVENQLEDIEVNASNIRGLDSEISNVLDDWDFTSDNKLMDAVQEEIKGYLESHIGDAVQDCTINAHQLEDLEIALSLLFEQSNSLQSLMREYAQQQIKQYQQQLLQKLSPLYWFHKAFNSTKGFCLRLYESLVSWRSK